MTFMAAVVLAAGKGTRMVSDTPKVLHTLLGKPMLEYVLDAAQQAGVSRQVAVIGNGAEQVRQFFGQRCAYALQEPQLGTGHAVMQALPCLAPEITSLLVLCGDTPLLTGQTLSALKQYFADSKAACTIMTTKLEHPGAYGRIIRDGNEEVSKIVEAKDAAPQELQINEINSGVYCFDRKALEQVIGSLQANNNQGEYYLTDAVAAIKALGHTVNAFLCSDPLEISGVNDRVQLAQAAKVLRQRKNRQLMLSGVTIVDPETAYIDQDVQIGRDTVIEPQVQISGKSQIGANCQIGPMVKIVDSQVGDACAVGPFAYLRPGTQLGNRVKAGHFVEIKKSVIGDGSKVPHLSYIGDAELGQNINIGCGSITCNYDGVHKYKTEIGDGAFIGSNTNFIAPVKIGRNCTVAAGSTINMDVPDDALAIARAKQSNIENWAGKKQKTEKNNS